MADDPIVRLLQAAMDRLLSDSPELAGALAELEGKTIALDITGTGLIFYLQPGLQGLHILRRFDGTVDTTLSGTPWALAALSLQTHPDRAFFSGSVQIAGDLELGQTVQNLLSQLNFDWEEALSGYLGDPAAHALGRAARSLSGAADQAGQTLRQNLSEYLREELRILPSRIEIENYMQSVDELRGDVDRLVARIVRMEQRS